MIVKVNKNCQHVIQLCSVSYNVYLHEPDKEICFQILSQSIAYNIFMEKEEQCHLIRFLNYVVLSNSENYEDAKIENIKPRHHQLLDLISTNGRTCKKKITCI